MLASKRTGADTAAPPGTHRDGNLAGTSTGITGMETLLLRLLPGMPAPASRLRPGPARRDWITVVCFSCGIPRHGVGRCPELDETFPYMLPGWSAEKVGANYMMISPCVTSERLRAGNDN